MSNEFEPFQSTHKSNEFSVWDYQGSKEEDAPQTTPEEQLIDELEILRKEAQDRGYAEGLRQAQDEIDEKKAELTQWIDLFQKPVQLLDEQLTQEVIQTVIWLSQHCIGIELTVHPEKFQSLFTEIKGELPSLRGNKILGMNPADVDWVRNEISDKDLPGLEQALFSDPTLNRGDFYLKGEHSELDGRIQTRLMSLFAKYINKDDVTLPQSKD